MKCLGRESQNNSSATCMDSGKASNSLALTFAKVLNGRKQLIHVASSATVLLYARLSIGKVSLRQYACTV